MAGQKAGLRAEETVDLMAVLTAELKAASMAAKMVA